MPGLFLPLKPGGHVEVFKRDGDHKTLVHTSRPCEVCGQPLEGLIVPMKSAKGSEKVHAHCRKEMF